jgi:hypothetical protein
MRTRTIHVRVESKDMLTDKRIKEDVDLAIIVTREVT